MGMLWCDQCGNPFQGDECHHCAQRRRSGNSSLEAGVKAWGGGGNTWATLDRADQSDGESWNPHPSDDEDDEAEGWPW
jgi:hypothetical protein